MLAWIQSKVSWIVGVGVALVTFVLGRYRRRAENAEEALEAKEIREDVEKDIDSLDANDKLERMRQYIPKD